MAQVPDTFQITLSHDELCYLLVALRMPPMMGMGNRYYPEELSREVVEARLQTAAQTLEIRGLVNLDNPEQVQLDTFIAGMLALPSVSHGIISAIITRVAPRAVESVMLYAGKKAYLSHHLLGTGSHHFMLSDSTAPLFEALVKAVPHPAHDTLDFQLDGISLDGLQALMAAANAAQPAVALLQAGQAAGLSEAEADAIVDLLAHRRASTVLMQFASGNEDQPLNVQANHLYHHVENGSVQVISDNGSTDLRAIASADIARQIQSMAVAF